MTQLDVDLDALSRDARVTEVKRLRAGFRAHRDASGHELCWRHPAPWALQPERVAPGVTVPDWPQLLRGCIRCRRSLDAQAPDAPRAHDDDEGDA